MVFGVFEETAVCWAGMLDSFDGEERSLLVLWFWVEEAHH